MSLVRIPQHVTLHLREFGDECAVYNASSSETHLLQYPAAVLLKALEGGSRTSEALCDALAPVFADGGADPREVAVFVCNAIVQFEELGLVEVIGLSE
jgi:PqqD family protein of HPr-rel-A system